ncbi:unnamed protein product [Trichogramma brassicae]|uniref:Peptidase S1 domain-containing protein n=1 Tax=Trichogramma brassicae TaxID=86971 RepID=A0A6H5IAP8_9HYME|nr:unnamed protein product [Trichogramma brassicae]
MKIVWITMLRGVLRSRARTHLAYYYGHPIIPLRIYRRLSKSISANGRNCLYRVSRWAPPTTSTSNGCDVISWDERVQGRHKNADSRYGLSVLTRCKFHRESNSIRITWRDYKRFLPPKRYKKCFTAQKRHFNEIVASTHLNGAKVKIDEDSACDALFRHLKMPKMRHKIQFCAKSAPSGVCKGDSGGPAVVDNHLVGVISLSYDWGNEDYPDTYTKVFHYRDWISRETNLVL